MFRSFRCCMKSLKILNVRKFCVSKKHLHDSQVVKMEREYWEEKMKVWMRKYEDVFGISKLSEMHDRVLEVQKEIQVVQEKRRNVQEEMFTVQKKLQEMHDLLHKSNLGDKMYLSVAAQAYELKEEQARLRESFSIYNQTERELQAALSLAINDSQDHERIYREKTKYLSLITAVIGGLLGIIGSTINNWRHRKDIKIFAKDITSQVDDLQKNIEQMIETSNSDNSTEGTIQQTKNFISDLKTLNETLQKNFKELQSTFTSNALQECSANNEFYLDLPVQKKLNQMEENIYSKMNYNTSIHTSLIGSLILISTLVIYFSNNQ